MREKLSTSMSILGDRIRLESSIIKHKLTEPDVLKALFKLVFVIFLLVLFSNIGAFFYTNMDSVQGFIEKAGIFGPIIIVLLIVLEVIIAPLPGLFVMITAGYLYGPVYGSLYSYIGNVLGSLVAFLLAHHFGRPFVEKIVSHSLIIKYDRFFKLHRKHLLFLYALPIIPVDILSFICGLSKLDWKKFLIVVLVGFIPNTILLASLGDYLSRINSVVSFMYALLFIVVFGLLAWALKIVADKLASFHRK